MSDARGGKQRIILIWSELRLKIVGNSFPVQMIGTRRSESLIHAIILPCA